MDKLAAVKASQSKIDRLIVANLGEYSNLQGALSKLISEPNAETASEVENQFEVIASGLEAIRNAIATLATVVSGDGNVEEIDAVQDENGMRIS